MSTFVILADLNSGAVLSATVTNKSVLLILTFSVLSTLATVNTTVFVASNLVDAGNSIVAFVPVSSNTIIVPSGNLLPSNV